jgi:uncharacterized SAM-binding protein YcdF (DUF218 family)
MFPIPMYSAVIVLANLMSAEGILNAESRARMDMAIDAVKAGEAPFLVTCGWAYREDLNLPIAYAMRDYALAAGVLSDRIIVEKNSRDTVGDAVFTHRNLAIPRSWDSILVITSKYHTARTHKIFSFIYGKSVVVRGAPADDTFTLHASELLSLASFRKTFIGIQPGDAEAIYKRLKLSHPFYNGKIYPSF